MKKLLVNAKETALFGLVVLFVSVVWYGGWQLEKWVNWRFWYKAKIEQQMREAHFGLTNRITDFELPRGSSNMIAIGCGATPDKSNQIVVRFKDGSEARFDLPPKEIDMCR